MTGIDVAQALPDLPALRDRCRSLAMVEAIISPNRESRRYSFNTRWAPAQELASMSNGAGDEWNIAFTPAGAIVFGFDHESAMSPAVNDEEVWPGLIDSVPAVFAPQLAEPAFHYEDTLEITVCLWRRHTDDRWHAGTIEFPEGADPDGADWMFLVLLNPDSYADFAKDYYNQPVDAAAVAEILAQQPLTAALVQRLNPDVTLADLHEDLVEIGYPTAGSAPHGG